MTKHTDSLPSVEYVDVFDTHGTSEIPKIEKVYPIINSEQKAIAGQKGNTTEKLVGYMGYSPYFNCLVYLVEKNQRDIIRKVDGGGFAISESIIQKLKNKNVKYIFGKMRPNNIIVVIPVDKFVNEFHVDGWDKQLYAVYSEDVEHEIRDNVSNIFSKYPSESENAITFEEANSRIPN